MSEPIHVSAVHSPSTRPPGPMVHGDPCTLVIFGAAGDLARRKLVPAIYQLAKKDLLAAEFRIVGVGIEALDDEKFRAMMREALGKSDEVKIVDEAVWKRFGERMFWVGGDLTQAGVYAALKERLAKLEAALPPPQQNRLFYLSVPPAIFEAIAKHLSASELAPKMPDKKVRPWRRVILEKPFGRSLSTALALNKTVLDAFAEPQVYRIDHYVGKETVQNVLVFRSANAIFESLWSREHISHVEITAAETVGLEGRARYYESAGVVRDMFQNHLFQLLALTAMEPPNVPNADAIRDEKVKVLRSVSPLVTKEGATGVHAQYAAGQIGGKPMIGYREEPDVKQDSRTPTFAALRVTVDNDRWRGVPFYLRSGKRMAKRTSEIAITFKLPKQLMYEPHEDDVLQPNVLAMRLQPDDGISLGFEVKIPGAALALTPGIEIAPVQMDFAYEKAFGSESHPAYETLLLDAMIGDATLFTRSDEVEAAWRVVDPLLEYWESAAAPAPSSYAAGSWGPAEADALLAKDGFAWRKP